MHSENKAVEVLKVLIHVDGEPVAETVQSGAWERERETSPSRNLSFIPGSIWVHFQSLV